MATAAFLLWQLGVATVGVVAGVAVGLVPVFCAFCLLLMLGVANSPAVVGVAEEGVAEEGVADGPAVVGVAVESMAVVLAVVEGPASRPPALLPRPRVVTVVAAVTAGAALRCSQLPQQRSSLQRVFLLEPDM